MYVGHRVLDVVAEVADKSATVGAGEVVVDPAYEDVLWRQLHEVFERFTVL